MFHPCHGKTWNNSLKAKLLTVNNVKTTIDFDIKSVLAISNKQFISYLLLSLKNAVSNAVLPTIPCSYFWSVDLTVDPLLSESCLLCTLVLTMIIAEKQCMHIRNSKEKVWRETRQWERERQRDRQRRTEIKKRQYKTSRRSLTHVFKVKDKVKVSKMNMSI